MFLQLALALSLLQCWSQSSAQRVSSNVHTAQRICRWIDRGLEEESSQYGDLGFCLSKLAVLFTEIKKGEEMDGDSVKSRVWVWLCFL